MSNPGGTFTTGPSTSPVLSEPASQVALGNPIGPAPSTGPLTAYVDAKASTDAQKANLLASIATLGSVGKQAFVQQQQQTNQARQQAIQGINAATGMAGTPTGVSQALGAAFAGQQQANTNQQGALDQYQGSIAGGAGNWYDKVGAAIPIMQERTSQQVNSFYAAQRLQAQRDAATFAQTQADKQAQIQIALANAQAAGSRAQGAASSASAAEDRMLQAGITLDAAQSKTVAAADKIIGPGLANTPDLGPGTFGNQLIYGSIAVSGSGQAGLGKAVNAINQWFANPANKDKAVSLNQQEILAWLSSYYQGSAPPSPASQAQLQSLLGAGTAGARSDVGVISGAPAAPSSVSGMPPLSPGFADNSVTPRPSGNILPVSRTS